MRALTRVGKPFLFRMQSCLPPRTYSGPTTASKSLISMLGLLEFLEELAIQLVLHPHVLQTAFVQVRAVRPGIHRLRHEPLPARVRRQVENLAERLTVDRRF